jgi:hypothetical protein
VNFICNDNLGQWKAAFSSIVDDTPGADISNNPTFRLKHTGVLDGSDGSDATLYQLTENYTLPVALLTRLHYYAPGKAPSERHVCYTLRRGCSYTVAIHTTPRNVYASLQPTATFYLSAISIYRMPHLPHLCSVFRFCHILKYSLRFGYLACCCICFAIIVFYKSEIYSLILTLCSTMTSVLHILS